MDPQRPEHAEPDLDALLRRSRPEPDGAWVHATGEGLFAPRRSWRPSGALRLGSALVVGLATVALLLSLAGAGPLAGGDRAVEAKDDCRTVTVARVERVPAIVTDSRGTMRVVYTRERVRRLVRRCR